MQDDRARAEALLFFNGKRNFLDEDEALYASKDVDPAIEERATSVQELLPLLQQEAAQLSEGIQVRPASSWCCPMKRIARGCLQRRVTWTLLELEVKAAPAPRLKLKCS